jgi:5-methylcytosine-specific restriction endonuclease McrA
MPPVNEYHALKLDASWKPIAVVPAMDALILSLYSSKCQVIETWDREVSSPNQRFELPSVIVIRDFAWRHGSNIKCNKTNIFARDSGTCQYCGIRAGKMTIDHVVPKSKGGKHTWDNVVTCCESCNQKKGSKLLAETGMKLMSFPKAPKSKPINTTLNPEWCKYV